jgi:adenylate cyclase
MAEHRRSVTRHKPDRSHWLTRYALWILGLAPVIPQLIGSAFNIWYVLSRIQPLLTPTQHGAFTQAITIYNLTVYPIATYAWIHIVLSLKEPFRAMLLHHQMDPIHLMQARRRVINLPWLGSAIAGMGWLLCIPTYFWVLHHTPDVLNPLVSVYLSVSLLISALIAITHSFFAIEIISQRVFFPTLFQGTNAADIAGAFALSLRQRGLLLAISAGVCPIISLLLLSLVPQPTRGQAFWFALGVGGLGIVFGLVSAWMVGRIVVEPVEALQKAARAVANGQLNAHIQLKRADEFGPLIEEFNHMLDELQEKQRLRETFGRHVGEKAAQQILRRDPSLGGGEQELTVLFADLRNFTARSSRSSPRQVVALLNLFLTEMVEIVEERYGGMVNKFLGDGFMALFGVGEDQTNHAAIAVAAAQDMLTGLQTINDYLQQQGQEPLAMGIGIHTGSAVVGSIGATQRLEYTAIGDTVNIASRVEALTKQVKTPLLITEATRNALPANIPTYPLPPQWVKGKAKPIAVYSLSCDCSLPFDAIAH